MISCSPLPRLRQLFSARAGRGSQPYTADEVRALLDPQTVAAEERQQAVLDAAAVPSSWTGYVRPRDARELGRVAERLPTILHWYRSGLPLEEIGRRLGPFGGPARARRALEVAASCIAARLNARGLPALQGAG